MSLHAPHLPVETLVDKTTQQLSLTRKLVMLSVFCFAQFLDAFNNAALFPAIPALERSVGINQSQSAWIISAFQLTFASFLLISGRMSDLYDSRLVFIAGLSLLGIVSLGAGFVNNKIIIIMLRALTGIGSAMTIPSALSLLVHFFPKPLEQAHALSVFGGCGASADILGLFIGAVLVQYASYRWIFWLPAILSISVAVGCVFAIPSKAVEPKDDGGGDTGSAKWKSLDLIGISIFTVALILFIYGVTSGSADGWTTPGVLIPLIASILLTVGFFYWETLIPFEMSAIPPRTWFYKNFSVLIGLALLPFFWWNAVFVVVTTLWQNVFHWTVISTAVHMLPLGLAATAMGFTGSLSRVFSAKWIILVGLSMAAMATAVLALGGNRPGDYWPHVFPAFIVGSGSVMLVYTHTNIAIFQTAPSSMAGTVGAIFNGALQFGSAIGLAVFTSIETSVGGPHGGARAPYGRAAAFWFLGGILLIEMLFVALFYQTATDDGQEAEQVGDHNGVAAESREKWWGE